MIIRLRYFVLQSIVIIWSGIIRTDRIYVVNEIEASYEILRKYQKYEKLRRYTEKMKGVKEILI